MSRAKSKQILELAAKNPEERFSALQFETPLHAEAFGFLTGIIHEHPDTPAAVKRRRAENVTRRIFEVCRRGESDFLRALADVIEDRNHKSWGERERFIYAHCSMAEKYNEPLPSAGQLLRGWKIACGIRTDWARPADTLGSKFWRYGNANITGED